MPQVRRTFSITPELSKAIDKVAGLFENTSSAVEELLHDAIETRLRRTAIDEETLEIEAQIHGLRPSPIGFQGNLIEAISPIMVAIRILCSRCGKWSPTSALFDRGHYKFAPLTLEHKSGAKVSEIAWKSVPTSDQALSFQKQSALVCDDCLASVYGPDLERAVADNLATATNNLWEAWNAVGNVQAHITSLTRDLDRKGLDIHRTTGLAESRSRAMASEPEVYSMFLAAREEFVKVWGKDSIPEDLREDLDAPPGDGTIDPEPPEPDGPSKAEEDTEPDEDVQAPEASD